MHVFIIIVISTVVVAPSSNHHRWSIVVEVPEHSRLHSQTTAAQFVVQTARLSNVAWTMCSTSTSSRYMHSLSVSHFISVCIVYAVLFHGCAYVCMSHDAAHSNCIGALDLHMHVCMHVTLVIWMSLMICAAHLWGVLLLYCTTRHTIQCLQCWISVCLCSWEHSDIMSCQCECNQVGMPVHYQWYLTECTANCMHLVSISQVFVGLPG